MCRLPKLKAVPERESYPIPFKNEDIEFIADAPVFVILVENRGYWQDEVDKTDRDRAVTTSYHGLYRIVQICIGFKNTWGMFRQAKTQGCL